MMSALNSFVQHLSGEELKSFEISNKRFTIKVCEKYLFIANSSKKHNVKKVKRALDNLSKYFFEIYDKKDLREFYGNISSLKESEQEFREKIQNTLEQHVRQFWDGIVNR